MCFNVDFNNLHVEPIQIRMVLFKAIHFHSFQICMYFDMTYFQCRNCRNSVVWSFSFTFLREVIS